MLLRSRLENAILTIDWHMAVLSPPPPQINVIVGPRKTSLARSSCHTKGTLHFDPLLHLIWWGAVRFWGTRLAPCSQPRETSGGGYSRMRNSLHKMDFFYFSEEHHQGTKTCFAQ